MNGTIGDIVKKTVTSMPVEITESEARLFNTFPANEVSSALQELIQENPDAAVTARAFDALMKLNNFDMIDYLINLYDKSSTQ